MEKIPKSEFLINNVNIFHCPICSEKFYLKGNSLECTKKHCFDIAKNGYVNFLLKHRKTQYFKEMFESRKYVNIRGFFKPMTDEIKNIIGDAQDKIILDLGCGEGSHLRGISGEKSINIGVDICKDAVKIAQSNNSKKGSTIFCVADIARLPLKENTSDIVTNILSPYNSEELKRVLKPHGTIIKVVPGTNYLAELRKEFFKDTEKEIYSNKQIVEHLSKNFKIKKVLPLNYTVPTDPEYIKHIVTMTPLNFSMTDSKLINLSDSAFYNMSQITVEFIILVM